MASAKFPGIPNKEIIWGWDASLSTDILVPIKATDNALWVQNKNGVDFVDVTNSVAKVEQRAFTQVVPVTTATTLGTTGGIGDWLFRIHAEDTTTQVVIKDGATTIYTWVIAAGDSNYCDFGWVSTEGAWELTCTGAGVTASGRFLV